MAKASLAFYSMKSVTNHSLIGRHRCVCSDADSAVFSLVSFSVSYHVPRLAELFGADGALVRLLSIMYSLMLLACRQVGKDSVTRVAFVRFLPRVNSGNWTCHGYLKGFVCYTFLIDLL